MKKPAVFLLAIHLTGILAACAPVRDTGGVSYVDPYAQYTDYDERCQAIYDDVLGEFYTAYTAAKAESNISRRQALMAIAEAKMLGAGVFLPTTSQGGSYAMTAIAPYTNTPILWGNDTYRQHDRIVVTQPIKAADYQQMKAEWQKKLGTGGYEGWVKQYLTGKGYTIKDSLNLYFDADPETWDVLATSNAADSEILVQTYDGLYEYDMENRLQPALAESYAVSGDGKVYTFKIRRGVKWVNNQGVAVADVKADDFVAGLQHMMDTMGGLEYLVEGVIVGASEYINAAKANKDFSVVGVEAVDEYTLKYTLEQPASYFMTMLGYGVFAPLSRSYYVSMGGTFGADFDSAADTYKYGKGPDSIAYNGPFVITGFTSNNSIVCKENTAYWNRGGNNIKTLTYYYTDGTDEQGMYNDFKTGKIDGLGLTDARAQIAKTDGMFDTYAYVSDTGATTYCGFFNVNRSLYANFNDASKGVSAKNNNDKIRSKAAMLNRNFRLALAMSIDRGAYNAQSTGEELKLNALVNSYVPGNFVFLEEEVSVKINGDDKTYPAGTAYGQIVQDQLDADKVGLTVWNGFASSGFDGWFKPEKAVEYLNKAVDELKAVGVEITAENPIKLDLPVRIDNPTNRKMKQVLKQSVEAVTGGKIVISLVEFSTRDDYLNATYWYGTGEEANFDLNDGSGWGPDYGDPQAYLDTMLPAYAGYITKSLGLF